MTEQPKGNGKANPKTGGPYPPPDGTVDKPHQPDKPSGGNGSRGR